MEQGIAKKTCDVLPMLNVFHSAVIDVRDFDSAVDDYARLLGRPVDRIEVNDARQTRSGLFCLPNMTLEIRTAEPAPAGPPKGGGGLSGIRLAGPGAQSIRTELEARGVPIVEETEESARGVSEAFGAGSGGMADRVRRWASLRLDPRSSRGVSVELLPDSVQAIPAAEAREFHDADSGGVDPAASISGLDHVVVFSAAPDATRSFYADGLGIRLALDKTFEKRGVRLLFFRIGGVTIEIGGRVGAEPELERPDRFGGLAWKVPQIDAIHARLAGEGFDVSGIRDGNKPGTRVCTVREPVHGVPTLLIEPVS